MLEYFTVQIDCKKKNFKNNDWYNPVDVNSVTNLEYKNPMGGKKELALHIQRSFFANVLNYVTDTLRICNSNHLGSESCASGCIPSNVSKFNFNQFFLSDKSYSLILCYQLAHS